MPGTLVIDAEAPPPGLTALAYGPESYIEEEVTDLARIDELRTQWPVVWLDVDSLSDESLLRGIEARLGLHRLVLEDVTNLGQRAKAELYDNVLFIVLRIPEVRRGDTEQVSLLLQDGLLVTVQERPGDCFEAVRDRIRHGKGKIRVRQADYLAYALTDAAVDQYFPVLDEAGVVLDSLEDEVFDEPTPETLEQIHSLKRSLVSLRKAIWPYREMLNVLMRDAGSIFADETQPYLRDCYDHVVRLIDLVEAQREVTSDLLSMYLSTVSNRMNEVMKVLTIIATIFIPLSFIAGVYGMNFDPAASRWNMPELGWAFGYPAALLLMGVVAGGLLAFVSRRGWL
jgi:magnesium transporter